MVIVFVLGVVLVRCAIVIVPWSFRVRYAETFARELSVFCTVSCSVVAMLGPAALPAIDTHG